MEHLILEDISKQIKGKKVNKRSQHGFRKGLLLLINLIDFHNQTIGLLDEGRAVDVFCLDFSKALTLSPITSWCQTDEVQTK